jgi:hypothetical protein
MNLNNFIPSGIEPVLVIAENAHSGSGSKFECLQLGRLLPLYNWSIVEDSCAGRKDVMQC